MTKNPTKPPLQARPGAAKLRPDPACAAVPHAADAAAPATAPLKRLVLALALAGCGPAMAQVGIQAAPAAAAAGQGALSVRERTRQAVEQVQADQPGVLDAARTLGAQLTPEQQQARKQLWQQRAEAAPSPAGAAPASLGSREQAVRWQWPSLAQPAQRQMLQRPDPLQETADMQRAFTPDFSRQRLTLASLAKRAVLDLPQNKLTDAGLADARQELAEDDLQGLGLPELVRLGLAYSPVVDQVNAQLEAAMARTKQARAELLPRASMRLSKGKERSESETIGVNDHITAGSALRITQPLFNLPLIGDWQAQLGNERAAHWRLMAAREAVALAVTQATINLATARLTLDQSAEQLERFNRLLDYVQARARTGVSSAADLERTRTRVLLARHVDSF